MSAGPFNYSKGPEAYERELLRAKEEVEKQKQVFAQQASWLAYANQQNKWNWERGLGNIGANAGAYQQAQIAQVQGALRAAKISPYPAPEVHPSTEPDEFRWLRKRVQECLWYPKASLA